jgi:ATP-dependent Clp protease ATP-binding subunit ClpB
MDERLRHHVIGQDPAVDRVSDTIRQAAAGLLSESQPQGVFLFLGPTGVGKTELAKSIARDLFDSEEAMVRIDMSEFMEKHSVSRLIGAPPGYVGYDEGGYLTEAIRRKPYAVILLDEIEKAHPDVFSIFLQIFDDGRLTDGKGRTVNFRNTVIIMTSNIAGNWLHENQKLSYAEREKHVANQLKNYFKPEFINRLDELILFNSLDKKTLEGIIKLRLEELKIMLTQKEIFVEFDESVIRYIAEVGYSPEFGARPAARAIEKKIKSPLAIQILHGNLNKEKTIRCTMAGDKVVFE